MRCCAEKTHNLDVLGKRYDFVYQLYADIGILNDIWSEDKIPSVADSRLRDLLS